VCTDGQQLPVEAEAEPARLVNNRGGGRQ
jgi:hypothetical protein